MAKSKIDLPSADDVNAVTDVRITDSGVETTEATLGDIADGNAASGFLPRAIDVKMNRSQAAKFKSLMRELEDRGELLADGTPVNNRRRVVLWLIENY